MTNLFWEMSYNILIYIWYYEIDLKIGEKQCKPEKTKNILIIKIYLIIKYIFIFNKYIKGISIILNSQTYINEINRFLKSYILPDLLN